MSQAHVTKCVKFFYSINKGKGKNGSDRRIKENLRKLSFFNKTSALTCLSFVQETISLTVNQTDNINS